MPIDQPSTVFRSFAPSHFLFLSLSSVYEMDFACFLFHHQYFLGPKKVNVPMYFRSCFMVLSFSLLTLSRYALAFTRYTSSSSSTKTTTFRSSSVSYIPRTMSTSSSSSNMIENNYHHVLERVQKAAAEARTTTKEAAAVPISSVRLVAVSKTKPLSDLQMAYQAGCRIFGENYAQELVTKVPQMPSDCLWHFIGPLQSNKVNTLIKSVTPIHRLTVETVSSIKLAQKLNQAVATVLVDTNTEDDPNNNNNNNNKLNVMVQVNTSGEDSKSGMNNIDEVMELCHYIVEQCSHLQLKGLMTIGAINDTSCFDTLRNYRDTVQKELSINNNNHYDLELSMGMSGDFEQAIAAGSTNVRVGSTIFGERDYSKDK